MRLRTPAWEYKFTEDLSEDDYVDMQLSPYRMKGEMNRLEKWATQGIREDRGMNNSCFGTLTRAEYAYCVAAAYCNIRSGAWEYEGSGDPKHKKSSVLCKSIIKRAYKSLCYESYGKRHDREQMLVN